jgi:predicted PurR-regulated permease PerM
MNHHQQDDIERLVRENNKMLHSMRRNAFLGGIFKICLYLAFLLVPLWFYATYISGTVDNLVSTMNKVQGMNPQAQAQFSALQDLLKRVQANVPDFLKSATSSATTTSGVKK